MKRICAPHAPRNRSRSASAAAAPPPARSPTPTANASGLVDLSHHAITAGRGPAALASRRTARLTATLALPGSQAGQLHLVELVADAEHWARTIAPAKVLSQIGSLLASDHKPPVGEGLNHAA